MDCKKCGEHNTYEELRANEGYCKACGKNAMSK